jgi:putative photosynthetic complex assembly protein 2
MSLPVMGLIVAVLAWWASTGVVLWLVRRPERTFGPALVWGGVVAVGALVALALAARDDGMGGALVGFVAALVVWGWHELAFLTGRLAGTPASRTAPADVEGWSRFKAAAATVIHHEIALALTGLVVLALTWGGSNPTGALTFLVLFGMRLSTKLNIFLGVPNPPITFLPAGLKYLQSYFRRARFNALFPVSLAASIVVTILLAEAALTSTGGERTGYILMLSLAALGLLEHGFLMLPRAHRRAPESALWAWALAPDAKPNPVALATSGEGDR